MSVQGPTGDPESPDAGSAGNQPPSPFSREGGQPLPPQSAAPSTDPAPPTDPWPTYPESPQPGPSRSGPTPPPYPQTYESIPMPDYGANAPGHDGAPAYGAPPPPEYGGYPYENADGTGYQANPYQVNPYEVNPYQSGYGGYSPYGAMPQPHPQAVTALVLGIVGVTVCPFVGYAGLAIGSRVRKAIDAEPQRYTGRGMATAGFVLGIISIITTVLWILFVIIGFAGGYDG